MRFRFATFFRRWDILIVNGSSMDPMLLPIPQLFVACRSAGLSAASSCRDGPCGSVEKQTIAASTRSTENICAANCYWFTVVPNLFYYAEHCWRFSSKPLILAERPVWVDPVGFPHMEALSFILSHDAQHEIWTPLQDIFFFSLDLGRPRSEHAT